MKEPLIPDFIEFPKEWSWQWLKLYKMNPILFLFVWVAEVDVWEDHLLDNLVRKEKDVLNLLP